MMLIRETKFSEINLSQCYYVQVSHMAWLRTSLHPVKWHCQIRRSHGLNMCVCVCVCVCVRAKYETDQGGEETVFGLM